jgi:hypothetical protein
MNRRPVQDDEVDVENGEVMVSIHVAAVPEHA